MSGLEPPSTPISAKLYAEHGLPWFDLYDEKKGDVKAAKELEKVKSVKEMDKKKGFSAQQDDGSIEISPDAIKTLAPLKGQVRDGEW